MISFPKLPSRYILRPTASLTASSAQKLIIDFAVPVLVTKFTVGEINYAKQASKYPFAMPLTQFQSY